MTVRSSKGQTTHGPPPDNQVPGPVSCSKGQTTLDLPGKGQKTLEQKPHTCPGKGHTIHQLPGQVRQHARCQARDKSCRTRVRQPWGRHPASVRQGSDNPSVARTGLDNPQAARDGTRATEQGSDNLGADTPHASRQGSDNLGADTRTRSDKDQKLPGKSQSTRELPETGHEPQSKGQTTLGQTPRTRLGKGQTTHQLPDKNNKKIIITFISNPSSTPIV